VPSVTLSVRAINLLERPLHTRAVTCSSRSVSSRLAYRSAPGQLLTGMVQRTRMILVQENATRSRSNCWRVTGPQLFDGLCAGDFEDFVGFGRDRQMAFATFKDQQFWQVAQASDSARETHGFGAARARPRRSAAEQLDHPTSPS
jgi:hypothetical protein